MPNEFTLADCPKPYAPWMAGKTMPEITVTIELDAGDDLTGATVAMFLERDTKTPVDTLEKALVEVENIAGSHATFRVDWGVTDLIEGRNQQATFVLTDTGSDTELIGRFLIDVIANPDPTP